MDFSLTETQKGLVRDARIFAEAEFPLYADEADAHETFPRDLWKKGCDCGLVGVFWDQAYGGRGLGFLEHALIMEEFWRVDPGCGQAVLGALFGSQMIHLFGTKEQKRRYLTPLARGEAIMGSAITEPDAGSDVSSVATRAERKDGRYILNGNKMFISNGSIADYMTVLCVTHPEEENRHRRQSVLIVETDREGFEANKLRGKLGIRASDTAEVTFSNVFVPEDHLVGEPGRGFYHFMEFFNHTRVHICAQGVGVAQGAFERTVKHVKSRRQFGKPLGSFQAIQFRLAEMATRIEAARSLYWRAGWNIDHGIVDHGLVAMAKWFAGEVGVYVAGEAVRIHGGIGVLRDYGIERLYRDAKIVEIYEGTKEIEKLIVARNILGRM
ncbi:MAG: acyl-CoA dehydrogenase [Deltaproteobacteria bacterium]|nr:MAG: acyl-CoA dehydrogenase [Deltaproteobacteria bacterium]